MRTVVIPTDAATMNAGTEPTTLPQVEGIHLPAEVLRAAAAVQRQFAPQLMADPAFFGVGVTQSYDNPAEAALLVLVDLTKTPQSMPDVAGGLRMRYMRVNRLHVTRSKFAPAQQAPRCVSHRLDKSAFAAFAAAPIRSSTSLQAVLARTVLHRGAFAAAAECQRGGTTDPVFGKERA